MIFFLVIFLVFCLVIFIIFFFLCKALFIINWQNSSSTKFQSVFFFLVIVLCFDLLKVA